MVSLYIDEQGGSQGLGEKRTEKGSGGVRHEISSVRVNAALIAFNLTKLLIVLLPIRIALRLGRALGWCISFFAQRDLDIAVGQILLAARKFPDIAPDRATALRIYRKVFSHIGESLVELLFMERNIKRRGIQFPGIDVTEVGTTILTDSVARKHGIVALSGHLGNFELLAAYHARQGHDIMVIGREPNYSSISDWLDNLRNLYGIQSVWRSGRSSATAFLRALREYRTLAVLIDQDASLENGFSPFFGVAAASPIVPIQLAIRHNIRIITSFIVRVGPYTHHVISEPIEVDTKDPDAAQKVLDIFNSRLEALVHRYPDQWVWFHRRWRRRPNTNYEQAPEKLRTTREYLAWLKKPVQEMISDDNNEIQEQRVRGAIPASYASREKLSE